MDVLSKIQWLNPTEKLRQMKTNKSISLSPDEKVVLEQVYRYLYPAIFSMNMGCYSCVETYFAMLEAYYNRESNK